MIKFTGMGKGGRHFFFGLDRRNIDRLTHDQPIVVDLAEMNGPAVKVVILFEETNEILFQKLKDAGAIDEDTIIHAMPDEET